MSQSRGMSLVEAGTNVTAGLLLSLGLQLVLFPAVGLQATIAQNLKLAFGFTALSLVRGYVVRRLFVRRWRRSPGGGSKPAGHEQTTGRLATCTCGHDSDRGSRPAPGGGG